MQGRREQILTELRVLVYGLFLKMGRLLGLLILLRMLGPLSNYRKTVETGHSGVVPGVIITVVKTMEHILVRVLTLLCPLQPKAEDIMSLDQLRPVSEQLHPQHP